MVAAPIISEYRTRLTGLLSPVFLRIVCSQIWCKTLNFSGAFSVLFYIHMNSLAPELRDFILFCVDRRGAEWPHLYDEMALVAGQRLYKGLGRVELEQLGLSLALDRLDRTLELVRRVMQGQQT
jgi:hypothetical protein